MKYVILFMSLTVSLNALANTPDGLSEAFKTAIKSSDVDFKNTQAVVTLEEEERLASWYKQNKKEIVIDGTSAVDIATAGAEASQKINAQEYSGDDYKTIEKDLKEIH